MNLKTNTSKYSNEKILTIFKVGAETLGIRDQDLSALTIKIRTCRRYLKFEGILPRVEKRSPEKIPACLKAIDHYKNKYYRGMYKFGKNIEIDPEIVITLAPGLPLEKAVGIILHELAHHKLYLTAGPRKVGGRSGESFAREAQGLADKVIERIEEDLLTSVK